MAACLALALGLFGLTPRAHTAQFSEPDLTVFGKVINLTDGGAHQLYSGALRIELVSSTVPRQVLQISADLRPVGLAREYSYRVGIPLFAQPSTNDLNQGLPANSAQVSYSVVKATLDGYPVTLADPAQARSLITSSAARGREIGVDFNVSRPEADSDGDGIPDWWDDLHGLNKFSAADATLDPDGDGLTNLQEFLRGTHPRVANTTPLLLQTSFQLPVGGTAGLALNLVNQGASPEKILLSFQYPPGTTVTNSLSGLVWQRNGTNLPAGAEFTYRDALDGRVTAVVPANFSDEVATLRIRDTTPGRTAPPSDWALHFRGFSPGVGMLQSPTLWLRPESIQSGGDWRDASVNARDAYQPLAGSQPTVDRSGAQMRFDPPDFLYLDDRQWSPVDFTAFMAFGLNSKPSSRQTLFNHSKFEISAVGETGQQPSLSIRQSGRSTLSSPLLQSESGLITMASGPAATWLDVAGQGMFVSTTNSETLPSVFTTLGASRPISSTRATNFLNGSLKEVVFFDATLSTRNAGQVRDYLLSRWENVVVWNYRNSALAIQITGSGTRRNSIAGGYGDDYLSGGDLADILQGAQGRNRLRGGAGPDRFVFEANASQDIIEDFSPADGDVLDLNAVFATARGLPPAFVNIQPVVVRGTDGMPHVDSVIQLSYSGEVTAHVDQTITLKDVAIGNSDLLRLIGLGSIQVGGLGYGYPLAQPQIVAQPLPQATSVGGSVTLSVQAKGTQPLKYQWLRNGAPLAAAANQPSLTLNNLSLEASGDYSVLITNPLGSTTSVAAALTVEKQPAQVLLSTLTQTYDGTARIVSASTVPPNLPVWITYNGDVTPPVAPGVYAVMATIQSYFYSGSASGLLTIDGPPTTAQATAFAAAGSVVWAQVTRGGYGYTTVPLVRVLGGGGSGARVRAIVGNGVVVGLQIVAAGSGYTSAPTIEIQPPVLPAPRLALGRATRLEFTNVVKGQVYQLQNWRGNNWASTGIEFQATNSNLVQWSPEVLSPDTTRLASLPMAQAAQATPVLLNGALVAARLASGGGPYNAVPQVRVSGPGGRGAVLLAQIAGGAVTNVQILQPGTGYTPDVQIQVDPPPQPTLAPAAASAGISLTLDQLLPNESYQVEFGTWPGAWSSYGPPFDAAGTNHTLFGVATNDAGFFRARVSPIAEVSEKSD